MKFLKSPNTYFIMCSLIVITAVFTWFIQPGEYERVISNGKEIVVNGTYKNVEPNPQSITDIFKAPIKGFVESSLIIGLVFIVGGAFGIFQKTEAINSAIKGIAISYKKYNTVKILLIPVFMSIFSLAGAIFGMSEEVIPFILIFVPLALALGYDTITGVSIPFLGAGVGFAGAFLNPFTLGIAQGIAEVPLFSGFLYRFIIWIILTATAIIFVSRYASKIKTNPSLSPTYESDREKINKLDLGNIENFRGITNQHKAVLFTFLLGILTLIFGVVYFQWFIEEISAVFLVTGIAIAFVGKLGINETTKAFLEGGKELFGTAIIIAFARGITVVATEGKIIDTLLFNLSGLIENFHPVVSSQAMFLVQTVINLFIPSGSGQAALTMPIMAPLSDLVGVTRQTAVLAFQFGDGFSNMIIPTSAVTMGVLTLANLPWEKWAKWLLPLQIIFLILGLLLLLPPYFLEWK